jgi:hypothetical protein
VTPVKGRHCRRGAGTPLRTIAGRRMNVKHHAGAFDMADEFGNDRLFGFAFGAVLMASVLCIAVFY